MNLVFVLGNKRFELSIILPIKVTISVSGPNTTSQGSWFSLTVVVVASALLEVVMTHADVTLSRFVQLRHQVEPDRHLVTAVVTAHAWLHTCAVHEHMDIYTTKR